MARTCISVQVWNNVTWFVYAFQLTYMTYCQKLHETNEAKYLESVSHFFHKNQFKTLSSFQMCTTNKFSCRAAFNKHKYEIKFIPPWNPTAQLYKKHHWQVKMVGKIDTTACNVFHFPEHPKHKPPSTWLVTLLFLHSDRVSQDRSFGTWSAP